MKTLTQWTMILMLVTPLALLGCGVTGPKINFGKADGSIMQAQGPGVAGDVTDPSTGTVVSSGSLYVNPAAAIAMVLHYVGNLFHKGAAASASVAQ